MLQSMVAVERFLVGNYSKMIALRLRKKYGGLINQSVNDQHLHSQINHLELIELPSQAQNSYLYFIGSFIYLSLFLSGAGESGKSTFVKQMK